MKNAGIAIAALVLIFGSSCLYGWLIMLLVGVLHGVAPAIPALPFWPCVGVGAALSMITGTGFSVDLKGR